MTETTTTPIENDDPARTQDNGQTTQDHGPRTQDPGLEKDNTYKKMISQYQPWLRHLEYEQKSPLKKR